MVAPLAAIAQAAQGFPETANACLRAALHQPPAFMCVRHYCILTKRLVGPWNGENLLVPVVVISALHGSVPDVSLLKALASLEHQRPPAIVTKEQNVAFGCAVSRVLVTPATNFLFN